MKTQDISSAHRKQRIFRLIGIVLSLALILGLYTPALAASGQETQSSWAEEIPQMLAAGNFIEGEVIAEVVSSDSLRQSALVSEGEELMDVTEAEDDLISGQLKNDQGINMLFIQRDDMTTEEILNKLAKDPRVVYAEPNYQAEKTELGEDEPTAVINAEALKDVVAPENDLTPMQWSSSANSSYHLEGLPQDASIHVPEFGPTGSNMQEPIVVAVIDSPIDFENPDLAPVAYTFSPEDQAALGCDVHGYNATTFAENGKLHYWKAANHGTHCAGIIGAAWNGFGTSGVASNVKLVSVQNCDADGFTSLVNILRAFAFVDAANERGCNIRLTSNSWGLLQSSRALNAAVRQVGEKWGVVSVFAAGNYDRDVSLINDVGGFLGDDNPYVVIVASMDCADQKSPFSNFGKATVDLGAPGSGILSTVNLASAGYFADAVNTNLLYEGFEGEKPSVDIAFIDGDGKTCEAETEVISTSSFAGKKSLKIKLDPDKKIMNQRGIDLYTICMNFGDVSDKGISADNYAGLMIGSKKETIINSMAAPTVIEGGQTSTSNSAYIASNSWINYYETLPEGADPSNLVLTFDIYIDETADTLYLDSIGIGKERVPYAIFDGTSMACPAVAGSAAVLLSANPELKGEEVVALIKSSVRKNEALTDITKTGGVIDLAVTDSAEPELSPSISKVEVSGKDITITGSRFTSEGSITVSRIVAGNDEETRQANVTEWGPTEVKASLTEEFKGILQVRLENKYGKYDTKAVFVSKSDNLYEEDLPLNQATDEPFIFDQFGDWETEGPLFGLDNKLYYLPCVTIVEETQVHNKLLAFDLETEKWTELAEIPEYLHFVTAAGANGKIVVKGETVGADPDGSPVELEDPEMRVYVYDIASASWSKASTNGVEPKDSIASMKNGFILAGGGGQDEDFNDIPATVRTYDIKKGAGAEIAKFTKELYRPRIAVKDDVIYAFDINTYTIERIVGGKGKVLKDALPEFLSSGNSRVREVVTDTERGGILVPVSGGILFVGPAAKDGSGDTYFLRDGENKFVTFEKRMSDSKVVAPAAASYNNKVYAIGTAHLEKGKSFFRAAALPEYASLYGAKVTIKNQTFNGKYLTPAPVVVLDGKTLVKGTDYKVEYNNNRNAGKATATIIGIGDYTGYKDVSFTIAKAKNPMTVKTKAVKASAKKKVTIKKTKAFTIKKAQGKVTFKKSKGNKKITISKTGKITVKKGLKKGTYKLKVKVTAAGNGNYKKLTKTVTVKIKVR